MRELYHAELEDRNQHSSGSYIQSLCYFLLILFALVSFGLAFGFAAIAVQYVNVPSEYAEFLTSAIACKAAGIAAFMGLGIVCFASINKMKG